MKTISVIILGLLPLLVSCDYPRRYRPLLYSWGPRVRGIELFLTAASILERETLQARAYVILDSGRKKEAESATWETMDGDILSVDQKGFVTGLRPGMGTICVRLDSVNATGSIEVLRRVDYSRIMLSEVFYDAAGSDDGKEFIEIYNDNDYPCDIGDMKVIDGASSSRAYAFPAGSILGAKSRAVVAQSIEGFTTAFGTGPDYGNFSFSLNNSGETVMLEMPDGSVRDAVYIKGGTADFMPPESWGSAVMPAAPAGQSVHRVDYTGSLSSINWSSGPPTPGL